MAEQGGFDLAQLDAEATDLDLEVGAAEIVERAVPAPAGQVARAVHARAWKAEGIGDEALRRESGTAQIAASQPAAGHVQFPCDPGRHGLQPVVQDVQPQVRYATADRAITISIGCLAIERNVGHMHGGLGDAVHVDEPRRILSMSRVPIPQTPRRECFTAENDVAQTQISAHSRVLAIRLDQRIEC